MSQGMPLPKRSRGRPAAPVDELKQKVILATLNVLLCDGYRNATLDRIAKEAKVAKKTIYRFVEHRDELIELALSSWSASFQPSFTEDADCSEQVFTMLQDGLTQVASQVLNPQAVAMFRLLQTDFPGKTHLTAIYQENGVVRGRAILADWLHRQAQKRLIAPCDSALVSNLILSMVIAEPLRELALCEPHALEIQERIRHAIAIFRSILSPG